MTTPGRFLLMVAGLFVAGVLQFGVGPHLAIGGLRPDFLVIIVTCFGLLSPPASAAAVGLGAGLMQGAMAGANVTHYITSRAVTGFLVSLGRATDIEFGVVIAAFVTFVSSLLAQGLLYFFAPTPNIREFAQATILMALCNAIFAVPAYATLRGLSKPKKV